MAVQRTSALPGSPAARKSAPSSQRSFVGSRVSRKISDLLLEGFRVSRRGHPGYTGGECPTAGQCTQHASLGPQGTRPGIVGHTREQRGGLGILARLEQEAPTAEAKPRGRLSLSLLFRAAGCATRGRPP